MSVALHLVQQDPAWAGRIWVLDKATHPREKLCGGGVTHIGQNILSRLGLPFEPTNFPVREVRLVYRDKAYAFFGNPVLRIVRRDEFDHWLVRVGEARGVRVCQGEGVKDIRLRSDSVEVQTERRLIRAQVVVAADGSRSFVRQRLKWEDESRVARLLELLTPEDAQAQWEFRDGVAIFDFSRMTDGLQGYYWDFPSLVNGRPYMNRGVFDSRVRPDRPKPDLKKELGDLLAQRGRHMEDYPLKGHPIRWFDKNGKFAQPRIILVGDAAGADPLFGEGIAFALGYGEPAAAAIADAFARQDFSFETYRERLLKHPLFAHLHTRVQLARFAYMLKYPWFVRLGWTAARYLVRLTRWRNPDFVPAIPPVMQAQRIARSPIPSGSAGNERGRE